MVNASEITKGLNKLGGMVNSPEVAQIVNSIPGPQQVVAKKALNVAKNAAKGLNAAGLPANPSNMTAMTNLIKKSKAN